MTTELVAQVLRTNSEELDNARLFIDSRLSFSDSTNTQNQKISDMIRTNQFLIGHLLIKQNTFERLLKTKFDKIDEEFQTLKDHLANNITDEALAKAFKENFNFSNEIRTLNQAIQEAKTLNKEAIQPDFGWTRRGEVSIKWIDPNSPSSSS